MEDPVFRTATNSVEINHNVFSHYGFAWKKLWKYFLELLLVTIVSIILLLPTMIFENGGGNFFEHKHLSLDLIFVSFEGLSAYVILGLAYVLLFQWPLEYGISYVNLRAARSEKFQVKDMFASFDNYWNVVFSNLLVFVIVGFGFALLIVPGIIFACKLSFVSYLVVDRKMEAVEAVKTSWQMTSGHTWLIFTIGFLTVFVFILGLLAFGVGVVLALMWIRLTFASVYFSVEQKTNINNVPLNT